MSQKNPSRNVTPVLAAKIPVSKKYRYIHSLAEPNDWFNLIFKFVLMISFVYKKQKSYLVASCDKNF